MPIKQEELELFISEYLDIDVNSVESLDKLKDSFATSYARKDVYKSELSKDPSFVNPLIGKRLGAIETKLKQTAKESLGVEFNDGEFKDKSIEDILELTANKYKTKHETALQELKSKFKSDPSELTKEWEEKLKLAKEEANNWREENTKIRGEFDQYKTNIQVEKEQIRLKDNLDKAFGSIKFAPEANELVIEGFKTKVMNEVKFGFDENNNFSTFDKDGKTIFNPKKHGQPYSPEEYLKDKAIEYKVYQLNNDGGKTGNQRFVSKPDSQDLSTLPKRTIHPSALQ
jgi:predicted phage tail protein